MLKGNVVAFVHGKESHLFPKLLTAFPVKVVDAVAVELCWALVLLLVLFHHHRSTVALQLVLAVVGKMYPLLHRHAAKQGRLARHPSFDPLIINLLALVVVDEDVEHGQL
ncbi:hypothetical protein AMTR_s00025p00201810 [Amborella trichopoda]|uniref:Uncharacterized protein n=1 Tax=Amborella trichopoda TaxID=13333 RepID=W1PR75_AMBTC|nr:hypothetical protein AMTR_s00025p00201810 [Amborella trichopoda]